MRTKWVGSESEDLLLERDVQQTTCYNILQPVHKDKVHEVGKWVRHRQNVKCYEIRQLCLLWNLWPLQNCHGSNLWYSYIV